MKLKETLPSYIVLFVIAAIIVLSIIFKWVGFGCMVVGFCCMAYAIGVKAQNAVLTDINERTLKQLELHSKALGEARIQLKLLTKALAKHIVELDLENTNNNEEDTNETEGK